MENLQRSLSQFCKGAISEGKLNTNDKYLIATVPSRKINIDDYPAVKKYLLSFGKKRLEQSGEKYPDGTRARKYTPHEWYEMQDTCAYYGEFDEEKIAFPGINRKWRFVLVEKRVYISAPMRFIT
ncbi:MAG: hypothetical protein ISN29_07310, partial [Gammaproteobacteria bacterium AqS3]|nr:hypothetical protein [Gammaproteobacteria bacterium AqS3]